MKGGFKSLLKNKNVLYVLAFIAFINILMYLLSGKYNAVILFCVIGYLASLFNKNMIVVLLITIIGTYFLMKMNKHIEGMKNENDEHDNEQDEEQEKNKKEKMKTNKVDKQNKPKIDYAKTLEEAYDNLDEMIGKDGIDKMTTDTDRLAKKQKKLMENMEKMGPLFEQATNMLNSLPLDGLNTLHTSVSNAMGKLGNLDLKGGNKKN